MTPRWHAADRSPDRRSWLETWANLHALPLRRRFDAVFLLMVGLMVAGVLLLCTVAVEAADRAGLLDNWTLRPLADERILTNVRDRLSTTPMLSAVLHGPENAVFSAQAGGHVHRYDPRTGLWSSEDPLEGRLLNRDFIQLRSGCGSDPLSRAASLCPDPASLWALNGDQGLARRTANGWSVVVGDSSLLGQTGQPLQNEDLTTVAASADGHWLAVGTRQDGVGLYDIREHRWLPTTEASRQLPSLRISHLVWWRDRFWVGGTLGLASLTPNEDGGRIESVPGVSGEVVDLDADPDGSLFALTRMACENNLTGCQRFVALDAPTGPVRELIGERKLYPELNLVGLNFAQYAANTLAVAGQRGVYTYDTTRHAWNQVFDGTVLATLPLPDGSGFYYAFAGGAGLFQGTDQPRWSVGDERIVRLHTGGGGEALALTEKGNVYGLPRNADARLVFTGTGAQLRPEQLRTGFAVGTTVVLFGPEGALLHDVARRRFEDVPAGNLPDWLKQPNLRFVSASDRLYALLPSSTSTAVYTLDGGRLADGSYYSGDLRQAQPLSVPAGLPDAEARAWVWTDQSLGLLATDGSVYRVSQNGVQRVTGPPVRTLEQARFLDVADDNGGLVVATDSGVRRYNAVRHEWSDTFRIAGKEIIELARTADQLLGRTPDNMLVQEGGQNTSAALLIGDGGFGITDAGVSDARIADGALFLAGQGRVERYDLAARRVGERWSLAGNDPVLIRALLDGKPLSLTGGQAFLADKPLDSNAAGAVSSLSTTDRQIVTVRDDNGPSLLKYLKLYDAANPAATRCFFRTPAAEGATRVIDARGFSAGGGTDGAVAVATDAGLRFYNGSVRSWLRGPSDLLPHGGRLYILGALGGAHLVLVDDQQPEQRVTIVPINSVRLPDSCSTDPVTVQGVSFTARAVAVDEAGGRVAWLTPDGAVQEWTPAQPSPREILATQTDAPPLGDLRRLYYRQTGAAGTLLATTDQPDRPLWRYDIGARRWSAVQLRFPTPVTQLLDLNLEPVGDLETVLARVDGGRAFIGSLGPNDQAVNLGPMGAPAPTAGAPGLGAPGSAILDVQEWGIGLWTFLLQDRIRTYDPGRRSWVGESRLPASDPSMHLGQVLGRAVVTAENGAAWLVGTTLGETPQSFARAELRPGEQTAIDAAGTVWRLLSNGEVNRCDLTNNQYACRTQIPAPVTLDPSTVLQVFENRPELLLFVTTDGVRGYDPRSFQWVDLPPEAANLRGPLAVRQHGSRLLLLGDDTLVTLVTVGNEGGRGYQATSLGGVRELLYDDTGQPWVRLDSGWRFWNGQGFAPPTFAPGSTGNERLVVQEGRQPFAVDPNGALYSGRGRMEPEQAQLPDSIPPDTVQALARLTAGEWWVVSSDRADRLSLRACATRTPPVCLEVVGTAALPTDFGPAAGQPIVSARITGRDDLELIDASGRVVAVQSTGNGQYQAVAGVPSPTAPSGAVADVWPTQRANVAQLPDGNWAFEPVVRFEVDASGALQAARPTSRSRLADRGALQIDPAPPLNARWLQWNRANSSFVLASPSGPVTIPKADFVIGDHLLFEVTDAAVAERVDLVHVANARGILTYRRPDLLLTDQNTVFQPIALTAPIEGAHGRFTTPAGDVPVSGGIAAQLQPLSGAIVQQVGDVTLREGPGRRVTGSLPISGVSTNALTDRGFLWDVDRRGLAYENGQLLLQSAAGVHPVNALASFDTGPSGLGTGSGRLRSEAGGAILDGAGSGAGLWRRDNGQWIPLPADPALDRPLLDDSLWVWRMTGGQLGVTLRGDAHAFAAGFGPDGFGFSTDRLLTASAHANRLYVMTAGLFEIADTPDALKGLAGRRLPPSPTESLEDVRFADGTTGLFRRAPGAPGLVARLDDASGQFQPAAANADPYTSLQLVNADRLRLTRVGGAGGQTQKELRLDLPAGGSSWVGFSFVQAGNVQRFPFDVVTAVAARGNQLLVGTAAGLSVSTVGGGRGAGFGDIQAFYALSDPASPSGPTLAAVTRIGQPVSDPHLMMARSAAVCIEQRSPSAPSFGPCRDPALLDNRLRVQNAFWQWTSDTQGGTDRVTGWYRDQAGQPAPSPIQFTDGRLPHDTLSDATVCDGKAYSLWQAGWLTPHDGNGLSLNPPAGSFAPGEQVPRQLMCLARPIASAAPGSSPIPAGLYAVADGGRWLQFGPTGWSPITEAGIQQALEERRTRPPIFERERLRLPPYQDGQGFVFEQRALDGRWLPIPWSTGPAGDHRLAIDHWSELLQQGNQVWAASQAGLVLLGRDPNGRAVLDPDRLVLIREPLSPELGDRPCAITDLEAADGAIRARCDNNSALVFSTQAAQTGSPLDEQRIPPQGGLFSVLPGLPGADPFAERVLVDAETAGRWRWRVTGRQGGQPGALVGRWFSQDDGQATAGDPGEEIQLAGGRFTFDRLTSVAVARPGTIEVGTDTGWIQAPRTRYHALDLRRPDIRNIDPTTFDAVNTTRVEDRTALCLRSTAGGYLRLAEDGARDNPQACPQHLADDDLWRYEREGEPVQALLPIRARNGGAVRQLRSGRFTDDLVAGPPVTGLVDGRLTYLLPTAAGVLRLNDRLTRTGIIGEAFTGLAASGTPPSESPPSSVPTALFMLDPTTPAYVGADGLYRLGEPGATREPLPLAVPQGSRVLAVEDGPYDLLRVRWLAGEVRGVSLISRDTPGAGVAGRLPLNASDFRPFTDRRGTLGNASPWLWVTLEPGQVIVTRQDSNDSQIVPLPSSWRTIEPMIVGSGSGTGRHRLLLVSANELVEINLDRIVEGLYPPPG